MMPFQPEASASDPAGADPAGTNGAGPIIVSARFEAIEIDLLRLATTQLVDMLDAATADPQAALTDPAFARLLPDAYRDDAEAAAEFRRFTSDDLLSEKGRNARSVLDTLNEAPGFDSPGFDSSGTELTDAELTDLISETDAAASVELDDTDTVALTLDAAAVQAWLRTLTDLRLTLAERLLIGPDGVIRLEGEEVGFLNGLYDWLGMVQESLVYAIDV